MALNNGVDFGKLLIPVYKQLFPEMDLIIKDLPSILNGLTMKLEPWKPGYEDRIINLDPTSACVQGLVLACMGLTVA